MLEFLTAHLPEKFFLDTSAFIKNRKGFTLVELVVVIAILGILAGLAIPRFMDATTNARGSRLVADLRTIESAETIYYAEKGQFATMAELVNNGYLAVEPIPPIGAFKVSETNQSATIADGVNNYTVTLHNDTTPKTVDISVTTDKGSIDLKTLMTKNK